MLIAVGMAHIESIEVLTLLAKCDPATRRKTAPARAATARESWKTALVAVPIL
jgi:hypothetical protein